jgi:hypothetical protein
MWRAVPDDLLDFKPHIKTNTIRTIMVHQLLSERRFFAQFVGTFEPPVEELLPIGEKPVTQAYIEKYIWLAKKRLPPVRPRGGWSLGPSSVGCSGSASGFSGGGCCTLAIIGRRCSRGCVWLGTSQSRRSTGRPGT